MSMCGLGKLEAVFWDETKPGHTPWNLSAPEHILTEMMQLQGQNQEGAVWAGRPTSGPGGVSDLPKAHVHLPCRPPEESLRLLSFLGAEAHGHLGREGDRLRRQRQVALSGSSELLRSLSGALRETRPKIREATSHTSMRRRPVFPDKKRAKSLKIEAKLSEKMK